MRKFNLRGSVAHIEEARFNGSQDRILGRNGDINAGSKQELMMRLAELASMINQSAIDTSSADEDTRSSREILEEAWADPAKWAEIGSGLVATIEERQMRDGFLRNFLIRGDLAEGSIPRIRVRTPNTIAIASRGVATHWPQYVRDKTIAVDEFAINSTPEVDELEMHQNSGDILEDKYYEAMEAIFATEDKVLVGSLRAAVGHYNAPTYFTGAFNQTILQTLREGVTDWLLPAQYLLLANDLISDIMVGNEFSNWFDPVSKWEIIKTGRIGNLLGLEIVTDGYREPTLQVLDRGESFVLSTPVNNGVYTDRGPVTSTPIDGKQKGTNTKGWNLNEYVSITFANAKATSYAKRAA